MARLAVGPSWASLTEAQRQQVTKSFGRYMSAIYADRFDSYAGQKLEVTGEQPAPSGAMVKSHIIKAGGEPVKVNYMMRRSGDSWLISDIYLDAAISKVATRRSEFAAILKREGRRISRILPATMCPARTSARSCAGVASHEILLLPQLPAFLCRPLPVRAAERRSRSTRQPRSRGTGRSAARRTASKPPHRRGFRPLVRRSQVR
jgi:hypothetical protein